MKPVALLLLAGLLLGGCTVILTDPTPTPVPPFVPFPTSTAPLSGLTDNPVDYDTGMLAGTPIESVLSAPTFLPATPTWGVSKEDIDAYVESMTKWRVNYISRLGNVSALINDARSRSSNIRDHKEWAVEVIHELSAIDDITIEAARYEVPRPLYELSAKWSKVGSAALEVSDTVLGMTGALTGIKMSASEYRDGRAKFDEEEARIYMLLDEIAINTP